MVHLSSLKLPTLEELDVPKVKLGTAGLIAGGNHMGLYCQKQNDEFMLCRREEQDPRKCFTENKAVNACAIEFFEKIKKSCLTEFEKYANCIELSSTDYDVTQCRNTQVVFDGCVKEHLNLHRPTFGYWCKPRILDSKRPQPVEYQPPEFEGVPEPKIAVEGGRDYSDHGIRKGGFM